MNITLLVKKISKMSTETERVRVRANEILSRIIFLVISHV